jgi:hypothetical protein
MNIKTVRLFEKLKDKKLELFLISKEVNIHVRQLELPPYIQEKE